MKVPFDCFRCLFAQSFADTKCDKNKFHSTGLKQKHINHEQINFTFFVHLCTYLQKSLNIVGLNDEHFTVQTFYLRFIHQLIC